MKQSYPILIDLEDLNAETMKYLLLLIHREYTAWLQSEDSKEHLDENGTLPAFKLNKSLSKDGIYKVYTVMTPEGTIDVTLSHSLITPSRELYTADFYPAFGEKIGAGTFKNVRDFLLSNYLRYAQTQKNEISLKVMPFKDDKQYLLKRGIEFYYRSAASFIKKTLRETKITNIVYPDSEGKPVFRRNEKGVLKSYVISKKYQEADLLTHVNRGNLPKSLHGRAAICVATSNALAHVHNRGVLHLDVTLRNIIYDKKSGEIKLIDYGLSSLRTVTKKRRGTPPYKAPEKNQTQKSDIFSVWVCHLRTLGVNLSSVETKIKQDRKLLKKADEKYEVSLQMVQDMLAEFDRQFSPPSNFPEVKLLIRSMLEKGLARDPDDRPTVEQTRDFFVLLGAFSKSKSDKKMQARELIREIEIIIQKQQFFPNYAKGNTNDVIIKALRRVQIGLLDLNKSLAEIIAAENLPSFLNDGDVLQCIPHFKAQVFKREKIFRRKQSIAAIEKLVEKLAEFPTDKNSIIKTILADLQTDLLDPSSSMEIIIAVWGEEIYENEGPYQDKRYDELFPFLKEAKNDENLKKTIDQVEEEISVRKKIIEDIDDIKRKKIFFPKDKIDDVNNILENLQTYLLDITKSIADIITDWKAHSSLPGKSVDDLFPFFSSVKNQKDLEIALFHLRARQQLGKIQHDILNQTWITLPAWACWTFGIFFQGFTLYDKKNASTKIVTTHAANVMGVIENYETAFKKTSETQSPGVPETSEQAKTALEQAIAAVNTLKEAKTQLSNVSSCWASLWPQSSSQEKYEAIRTEIQTWLDENELPKVDAGN